MNNNTEYRRKGRELTKGKILNIFLVGLIFLALLVSSRELAQVLILCYQKIC